MIKNLKSKFKIYKNYNLNLFSNLKNIKKLKKKKNFLENKIYTHFYYQLKEKQKLKFYYGIDNKKFFIYYLKSRKIGGNLFKNIIIILESRLDNFLYKISIGSTIKESKQIINHGCILVNNKKVNISSFLLNLGDIVSLKFKCFNQKRIKINYLKFKDKNNYNWIYKNYEKLLFYFKRYPNLKEMKNINDIDIKLISDFYSK